MQPHREVINPLARSSYRRYAKHPILYSQTLQRLEEARRRDNHDEAERLARKHSEAHGMRVRGRLTHITHEEM